MGDLVAEVEVKVKSASELAADKVVERAAKRTAGFRIACDNCHVVLGTVELQPHEDKPGFFRNVPVHVLPTMCPDCKLPLRRVP